MTEEEWWASTDVTDLLAAIEPFDDGVVTERKLRLFACGRARRVWHLLSAETQQQTVEMAERYADSEATSEEFYARKRVTKIAGGKRGESTDPAIARCCLLDGSLSGDFILHYLWLDFFEESQQPAPEHDDGTAPDLLRCIVGNPFRPVAFPPSWHSETAVSLANGIYAERAFDRLPILADALEEAGCDHADVLTHCRRPGPHARGCWVVDGVLGRS